MEDRREQDNLWLATQKELMNLVAALRTEQQVSANREVEVQKLIEHVEDLDEHLRGVGGKESLDTRINLYEHTLGGHTRLFGELSKRIRALEDAIAQAKKDLWALQYQNSVDSQKEGTKTERLKEWLGFWGKVIAIAAPIIGGIATGIYQYAHHKTSSNVDGFIKDLQDRKKDPKVKKMLEDRYGKDVY